MAKVIVAQLPGYTAGPTLAPPLHQSWLLHASTHLREIWMIFGKTWALKASFSVHHLSRFKIH